jgi:hypothetical protein
MPTLNATLAIISCAATVAFNAAGVQAGTIGYECQIKEEWLVSADGTMKPWPTSGYTGKPSLSTGTPARSSNTIP